MTREELDAIKVGNTVILTSEKGNEYRWTVTSVSAHRIHCEQDDIIRKTGVVRNFVAPLTVVGVERK